MFDNQGQTREANGKFVAGNNNMDDFLEWWDKASRGVERDAELPIDRCNVIWEVFLFVSAVPCFACASLQSFLLNSWRRPIVEKCFWATRSKSVACDGRQQISYKQVSRELLFSRICASPELRLQMVQDGSMNNIVVTHKADCRAYWKDAFLV